MSETTARDTEWVTGDHHQPIGIVAERFWPCFDQTAQVVASWAAGWIDRGLAVQIFTTRPDREWPAQFHFREIPVFRLTRRPRSRWATYRTAKEFAKRLSPDRLHGAVLCGIGDIPQSLIRMVAGQIPLVVYVNRQLVGAQLDLQAVRRCGTWAGPACRFVTDCDNLYRELCELIDPAWVDRLEPATDRIVSARSVAESAAARSALSDAHPIMMIDAGQPLVLASCDSIRDAGILDLITAWAQVIRVQTRAKLWLVGDGPLAPRVWARVRELDLAHSVVMPGYFDDDTELYQAADLFVHPARLADASAGLVRAMGHGSCIVSTETEWTRSFLEKHVNSVLVPQGNPSALAQAILFGLDQPELRLRLGLAAAATARRRFDIERPLNTLCQLLNITTVHPPPSL